MSNANGWLPPSSNNGTGGTLYKNMMTAIDAAMKSIGSAFDSTLYTPRWAGFVWLQGENDALDQTSANAYEKNLTNLIEDIRAKVNVSDLPVILPLIAVQSIWPYNSTVRAADVAVKQKLKNVDTLDTKGFPSDGIHFKAAGHMKIGTIAAQRWLTMHYNYGLVVPIANHYSQPEVLQPYQTSPLSRGNLFDASGRIICAFDGGALRNMSSQSWSNKGVFILQFNQPGKRGNSYSKKILNIEKK